MKLNKSTLILFVIFVSSLCRSAELDTYGGFIDIKGEATGFFHTEKIDGRWWLITPDGHGFYGIGMAHPVTDFTQAAVTFAYDGDQEAWLRGSIERMRDLGYNCVWSGPYCPERLQKGFVDKRLAEKVFREAKIPYAFPIPLIKHAVELKPGEQQPDVFCEEYRRYAKDVVADYVPTLKDDPWVIGYYYGFGSWHMEIQWINETIARNDSAGRERLIGILEARYNENIDSFNEVYGTSFTSFGALKSSGTLVYPQWIRTVKSGYASMPEKSGSQTMYDDAQALLGEIIEEVYRIGYQAIREIDKNHLIFGSYVKEATLTREMWHQVSPYIDVIATQHVSEIFPIGKMVEELDKPSLISDQPFGNVYPVPLITAKMAPGGVPDHIDRLVLYDILSTRISKDPDYIGVQFCACLFDQSHEDKAYELGQPGFFTKFGEKKGFLCDTVHQLNQLMLENVQVEHDPKDIAELDHKFHEVLKRYRQVMNDRKTFLKGHPAVVNP